MARSFSMPTRAYAPGSYGPFAVDSLTNADTRYLELTVTQTAPWPDVANVATITMQWNDGNGAIFPLAGVWRNRDGSRKNVAILRITPPSAKVTDGRISVDVAVPVECALSLVAVSA